MGKLFDKVEKKYTPDAFHLSGLHCTKLVMLVHMRTNEGSWGLFVFCEFFLRR